MEYRKIKASFIPAKKHLNRTFLIRSDISLAGFCAALLTSLHSDIRHFHVITKNGKMIFCPQEDEESTMLDMNLDNIGSPFQFIYDFFDEWQFHVTVYKNTVDKEDSRDVILLSGEGAGIWEYSIQCYLKYLDGSLTEADWQTDPACNLNLHKPEDTDKFDLMEEQTYLDEMLNLNMIKAVSDDAMEAEIPDDDAIYYHMLCDAAWYAYDHNLLTAGIYELVIKEFLNICRTMKRNHLLPEFYEELQDMFLHESDGAVIPDLVGEILINNGEMQECLNLLDQLERLFPDDTEIWRKDESYRLESLIRMKRFDEAEELIQEAEEYYGSLPEIDAARIHLLGSREKFDEAFALLHAKLPDMENCDSRQFSLLRAAEELYLRTGDFSEAERVHAIYSSLNDEADENDESEMTEEDSEASAEDLELAVRQFKQRPSTQRYSMAAACFAAYMQLGGEVEVHMQTGTVGKSTPLKTHMPDGTEWLMIYSSEETAQENHCFDYQHMPAENVIQSVCENGIDGICMDFDPDGQALFLAAGALMDMLAGMDETKRRNKKDKRLLS